MIVDERDNQPVFIGRVGENNSRPVSFYIGDILEKYPDAVFSLMHKRYGDQAGYPVNNTFFDIEENLLIWRPQSGDLADEGIGELQIKATYNGDILKTKVYKTETKEALDDSADPPEPWESWVEQIEDAAAAAEQAAEEAAAAVAHEPIIGLNGNWYTWDPETEEYVDTENPSRGSDATPDLITKAYANLNFPVSKGTQCYYSGKLYEAKQDIATSEAWTAEHWQETTLEEQVTQLKSALQAMDTATSGDVGKALSPKTVSGGKVTEWQFVEGGGDGSVALPIEPKDIMSAQVGRNLFNKYTISEGYNLNKDTGELVTNSYYFVSDFIEVEASTVYGVNLPSRFAWYKSDKTFISGGSDTSSITSPANAKYLKVDYTLSMLDSLMVCKGIARTGNDKGFPYEVFFPWLKVPAEIDAFDLNKYGAFVVNMFNKATATDGQYVDHSDGTFRGSASYFRSDYIPVKPNTEYTVSEPNRYAVYDSNYQYLTGANLAWNVHKFTTPNNAAYVVICGSPVASKDDYIIAETANYPAGYESYGVVVPWIKPKVAKSKYEGKTLVCFGDSITYLGYTETIEDDTGMTVINQGYSSGRYAYADDANQYVNAFALHNLIDAIVTNDYTIPDTIIGATGYEEQAAQLAALKQIDFTKVDFVSFALGTNDFSSETPLDNLSDPYDTDYFKGAIRYCIKTLLTAHPHLKIICATPFYRFWSTGGVVTDDCDTHQIGGKLLKDYCEAVEEASTDCHIPYVNNLNNAGVNEFNRLTYFNVADGLHPNLTGRAIIGHRIAAGILENL